MFLYRYRVGGYTEIKQRRMDGQVCVKLREKAMRIIETLEVLPPCLWEITTYQPTDGYGEVTLTEHGERRGRFRDVQ